MADKCKTVTELKSGTSWYQPVIACIKEVYRSLGHGCSEVSYQRSLSAALTLCRIEHRREVPLQMLYRDDDKPIGKGIVDFLIEGQAILELKTLTATSVRPADVRQLQQYLLHTGIQVGMLVNFPKHRRADMAIVLIVRDDKPVLPLPPPIKLVPLPRKDEVDDVNTGADSTVDGKGEVDGKVGMEAVFTKVKEQLGEPFCNEFKIVDVSRLVDAIVSVIKLSATPCTTSTTESADLTTSSSSSAIESTESKTKSLKRKYHEREDTLYFPKRRWQDDADYEELWAAYDLKIKALTHKRHDIKFKGEFDV